MKKMMNDQEKRQLYEKAISLWKELQVLMGIEESGELTVAIAKYIRKPSKETLGDIADEFADVDVMKEQFEVMFGDEFKNDIQARKERKLLRLKDRIESVEKQRNKPLTKESWTVMPLFKNINCPYLKLAYCGYLETPEAKVLCNEEDCPIKEDNDELEL